MTEQDIDDIDAYARVSTSTQKEDSQVSAIESVIATRFPGTRIRWYVDHGVSATKKSWKERPEFQRLIQNIQAGLVKILVVFARDRLCRNAYEWIRFTRILRKYRVQVVFAMPGHAPMTNDSLVEMIHAHMAYEEAAKIKVRTNQATYKHPAKLYGYITHTHSEESHRRAPTYSIDTVGAETLQHCFSAIASARKSINVAEVLSTCATLMRIPVDRVYSRLTDVRYTGSVLDRNGDPIFPRIISDDLFTKVRAVLNDFVSFRKTQRENALFTPQCAKCGNLMQIVDVLHEPQWKCADGHRVSVSVSELNRIVRENFSKLTDDIDVNYIQKTCIDVIKKKRWQLTNNLQAVERSITSLADLIVLHHFTHAKKLKLRKEYEDTVREKKALMHDIDELAIILDSLQSGLQGYSVAIKTRLQAGDHDVLPGLARIFIDHITVGTSLIEIGLKHSDLLSKQPS